MTNNQIRFIQVKKQLTARQTKENQRDLRNIRKLAVAIAWYHKNTPNIIPVRCNIVHISCRLFVILVNTANNSSNSLLNTQICANLRDLLPLINPRTPHLLHIGGSKLGSSGHSPLIQWLNCWSQFIFTSYTQPNPYSYYLDLRFAGVIQGDRRLHITFVKIVKTFVLTSVITGARSANSFWCARMRH